MALILSGDTGPSIVQSAALPTGSILQVIQTSKTDLFSTTSTSWVDWSGMSVTITPQFSNSKFLITLNSGCSNTSDNAFQYVKLQRNGADIALGDSSGNATRCWVDAAIGSTGTSAGFYFTVQKPLAGSFLDSPNTASVITYKLQVIRTNAGTAFFGRSSNADDGNRSAIPSVLTVQEIKG